MFLVLKRLVGDTWEKGDAPVRCPSGLAPDYLSSVTGCHQL